MTDDTKPEPRADYWITCNQSPPRANPEPRGLTRYRVAIRGGRIQLVAGHGDEEVRAGSQPAYLASEVDAALAERDAEIERLRGELQALERDAGKGMDHARYLTTHIADRDDTIREKGAQIAELRAAMECVEWQGMTHGALADYEGCPWCHETEGRGHAPDCTYRRLVLDPEQPQGGEGDPQGDT